MRVKIKFYLLTCLALLLAIALAPRAAQAATITISDQASCESVRGEWLEGFGCIIKPGYTVADGDVLETRVVVAFLQEPLTNNGTINFAGGGIIDYFVNNGTLSVTDIEVRLSETATNNGVITISAGGALEIFPTDAVLTNQNTIHIDAGGRIRNFGVVDNQGTITLACGGALTGNAIQGEPVQAAADCTPPTAAPSQSPTANPAGWNNSDVTVIWNWSDNPGGSGIDAANCTASSTSGEGRHTLNATCRDLAGNQGSAGYTVQIDKTAPTLSAAATTAANANGWYNSGVTVRFTCNDTLSGIPANGCPASQVLSAEGASVSSTAQTVTDAAGNSSAPSNVVTVQIDKSAPLVAVTGVSDGASYPLGSAPAAGCTTSDTLSGVASEAALSISGGNADGTGSFTVTCSGAKDNAGNDAAAVSVTYHVAYHWSGFFPPVENLPAVNSANAGQAIPIKFSLGGDYGLNIFAPGYPTSQQVHCDGGDDEGNPIEETATPGASGLQYDPDSQTYTYVWKTDKAWAGTCRQLTVSLVDGTAHTALFQFKGKALSASAAGDEAPPTTTGQGGQVFLPVVVR